MAELYSAICRSFSKRLRDYSADPDFLLESIEVAGADNLRCVTFRSPDPQTVPAGELSARDGLALRT